MSAAPQEISPADRTVGQLVADTIRLYQRRFWRALPLGLVVAVFNQLAIGDGHGTRRATGSSIGGAALQRSPTSARVVHRARAPADCWRAS